jgi:hypothetical protein
VIKLVVDEDGSELADELWSRAESRNANRLVYPQARALAMGRRIGGVDERTHRGAVRPRRGMRGDATHRRRPAARPHGGELAERHALRAYDAVHLATALSVTMLGRCS